MQARAFPSGAEALDFPSANQASLCWIRFESNGGSATPLQLIPPGEKITRPADPVRTGYTFGGWYADSALTISWDFNQIVSSDNITLYAKWAANTYTVTLDKQGGSGGPASIAAVYDAPMPSAAAPSRTGYIFGGYYDAVSGGTQYYTASMESVRAWDKDGDATLYARWTAITYTVAYNAGGGSGSTPSSAHTYDEAKNLTANGFSRAGYTFQGWSASSGATAATYTDRQSVVNLSSTQGATVTLYAVWEIITYTISWTPNGGTVSPANPAVYTVETPDIVFNNPERPGYAFSGWFNNSDFTGLPVTGIPRGSTGNRSYYAAWNVITWNISYELYGGQNAHENPGSYTIESSTVVFRDPGRRGYAFRGWYDNPGFEGDPVTTIPHGSAGDVTLYAKWEVIIYPVEYVLSGGENNPDNPDSYTVESPAITLLNAGRPGYGFAGWFDNAGFIDAPVSVIPAGSTGALKLFARWTKGVSFPTGREHIDRYGGDPKIF
jgi:uncharacterized repeat protein (TIGR02543 family)